MATLGIATLQTDVDQAGIEDGLAQTEKKTEEALSNVGTAFAAGLGAAIGGAVLKAIGAAFTFLKDQIVGTFEDLILIERLMAQTEAVIESTGGAAGLTAQEIADMSGALEVLTGVEAEVIQEGANMLLTFKNIGQDVFPEALEVINDMGVAMGLDLSNAAILVGKALNDPATGLATLTRVGITFTDEQKEVIQALLDTGDIAGAQAIILEELSSQFGGSAEAFGETLEGQMAMFDNSLGEIKESLLADFMPLIKDAFAGLNTFIKSANVQAVLSGSVKWIKSTLIPSILSIIAAGTLLFTGDFEGGIFGLFEDDPVITAILDVRDAIMGLFDFITDNATAITTAMGVISAVLFGIKIVAAITAGVSAITAIIGALFTPIGALVAVAVLLGVAWQQNWGGIREAVAQAWAQIQPVLQNLWTWIQTTLPLALAFLAELWTSVLVPAMQAAWLWVQNNVFPIIETLWGWLKVGLAAAVQFLGNLWTGTLLPAIKAVWDWVQTVAVPIITELIGWLSTQIPAAIETLSTFWSTVLLPAIETVWAWITENLFPLFTALGGLIETVLIVQLEIWAGIWSNVLQPAIEAVWGWITESMIPALIEIGTAIGEFLAPVIEWLADFLVETLAPAWEILESIIIIVVSAINAMVDTLSDLELPDWLDPGSPTPFELGLRGIARAAREVNKVGLLGEMGNLTGSPAVLADQLGPGPGRGVTINVEQLVGDERYLDVFARKLIPAIQREEIRRGAAQ